MEINFLFFTCESLIDHRKHILDIVGEYHTKLFNEDGRNRSDICHMSKSVQIYNSIHLSKMLETYIVIDLHFLADKLKHFHYEIHFHHILFERLKEDMS